MLLDVRTIDNRLMDDEDRYMYAEILEYDMDDNKYEYQSIDNPKVTIFRLKDEYLGKSHNYIAKLNDCIPIKTRYDRIQSLLLKDYDSSIDSIKDDKKLLHCLAYSNKSMYNLEFRLETYLRHEWHLTHPQVIPNVICGFLDIEVDLLESSDVSNPYRDPINCVTIINGYTKQVYTYILKRERDNNSKYADMINHQCDVYESIENDTANFTNRLHSLFDANYKGMKYHLEFHNDEVEMIRSVFERINSWNIAFLCIWNMDFDIPYIHDRLSRLVKTPSLVVTHKDFKRPYFKYFPDDRNDDFSRRNSYCMMSIYPRIICQMLTYASIRRGEKKPSSYSLDSISDAILGDSKLKYSDSGLNIRTLAYESPDQFIIYNIKDVLLQYGINEVTRDTDTLYTRSFNSLTPYEDLGKVTQFVRNQKMKDYYDMGYLLSGNTRKHMETISKYYPKWYVKINDNVLGINESPDTTEEDITNDSGENGKFAGAFVADPQLNLPVGEKVLGKKTNIVFDYVMDEDLSSMYPSMNIALNIDADTLMFKMTIDKNKLNEEQCKNKLELKHSSNIESTLFEYILTKQYYSLLENWYNAPSMEQLIHELDILYKR